MVTFGVVGLPNVGKSTLFNALLQRSQAAVSNYPFCTVEPNVSVVPVPDERLAALQAVFQQQRAVPTTIEIVDIAGLVRGAHEGHGLGNQFLAHIRQVDAVLHVVRCFPGAEIAHVEGALDPGRDVEIVELELLSADEGTLRRRLEAATAAAKAGTPQARLELAWAKDLAAHLAASRRARSWPGQSLADQDARRAWMADLFLLTAKPVLFVANLGDSATESEAAARSLAAVAARRHSPVVSIPARFELELADLEADEAELFRAEYGLREGALERLIGASYELMDLVTFYTGAGRELTAWTVPRGTAIDAAAGRIHSDMEAGFIRADVASWDVLVAAGSWAAAREAGQVATVGRSHEVQDGDVILVHFAA